MAPCDITRADLQKSLFQRTQFTYNFQSVGPSGNFILFLTYLLTYSHSVDSHYRDSLFFRKQNFFVCLLQLNHHLHTNTKANRLTRRKLRFISWWNDVLRATQINNRPSCFVRLAVMNINSASHLWFWGWVFFCSFPPNISVWRHPFYSTRFSLSAALVLSDFSVSSAQKKSLSWRSCRSQPEKKQASKRKKTVN